MKTKLALILALITQITFAQQVTLMQPALRDSDKNIIKQEQYTINIDTNVEHKEHQMLYTDYDDAKNPIAHNYESYDENGSVIDLGNTENATFEYYPVDNDYHIEGFYSIVYNLFPNKLVDAKLLNSDTGELLDYQHFFFSKDERFVPIDSGSFLLESNMNEYDENYNLIGGSKDEVTMQGDYPIEKLFYVFNNTTNTFEPNYKEVYYNTFDNGVLIERITKRITDFTTNVEENYMKEVFIFSTNTFERQFNYWDTSSNDWQLDIKLETIYNINNQPLSYLEHSWDETTSTWGSGIGFYYNYNALDLLETYTVDFGGNWYEVFTMTYNSDNLLISMMDEIYEDDVLTTKSRQAFYYELETASTNKTNISIINIYPNPTTKILNIDLESDFEYKIYSIQGKLLKDGVTNKQIQVSDLEKGIYFIHIKTPNLEEKQKFVVN